jgi:hypothetical protein
MENSTQDTIKKEHLRTSLKYYLDGDEEKFDQVLDAYGLLMELEGKDGVRMKRLLLELLHLFVEQMEKISTDPSILALRSTVSKDVEKYCLVTFTLLLLNKLCDNLSEDQKRLASEVFAIWTNEYFQEFM